MIERKEKQVGGRLKSNLKFKSNKVLTLLVICFYMFSLGSFGIRARWVFAFTLILSVGCALCFSDIKIIYIGELKKNYYFLVFVILLLISMPFARHESDVYNFAIFVIITIIGCLIARTNELEIEKIFKIFINAALFLAIYISFFRIFPGIYNATFYKLLSAQVRKTYSLGLQVGYGLPIGNGYTFADSAIQLGICAVGAKDLAEGETCVRNKIYILIMISGILLEGRKGELICALFTVIFMYYIGSNRSLKVFRNRFFFIILAMGVLILVLGVFNDKGLLTRFLIMYERLLNSHSGQSVDFTSGRFQLWGLAVDMFKDNPILGIGWGGFAKHGGDMEYLKDVHNCLLQLMCETGLIGTILICFPIIVITRRLFRLGNCRKKKVLTFFEKKSNIFCASVMFYLIILSFLDPDFYGPYFWYMLAIVVTISEYIIYFSKVSLDNK